MYSRKKIFAAACVGMLMFGIVMALLGALLPSVIVKYGMSKADAGTLFLFMSFGMLPGNLIFGPVVDRFGYKGLLVVCTIVIFGGFIGIALAQSAFWLKFSLFFIGFAGSVINGGTNALVSDISTESRGSGLSFLGIFFGIGAFGIPFALGTLLDLFTYEMIITGVGALFLLPLIFFAMLKFPSPKHARGFPVSEAIGLTKEVPLLLFGIILFLQVGMEMTVGGWAATFFNEELGVESHRSVLVLSLFWLGMIMGRMVAGNLVKRISSVWVMYGSLGIALTGFVILLSAQNAVPAVTGLIILGVGFAAIFPVTLGYVGDLYEKLSGTAFSIVMIFGLFGGMLFPYVTGVIADLVSLRIALMIISLSLAGILIVFRMTLKRGGYL